MDLTESSKLIYKLFTWELGTVEIKYSLGKL